MEDEDQKELQLLPTPHSIASSSSSRPSDSSLRFRSDLLEPGQGSVDLQLSISLRPIRPAAGAECLLKYEEVMKPEAASCVEALKWQAGEQIRLAAMEKAYAERVRELTKREIELAQTEFARARQIWERAREEVEKAERMRERASGQVDSTCMEITCQSCRQRFRPS
ncbi:protein indeterminate-domain 14-like [Cucurbita pepo subsp. pepo]|uniref:protein indeterminate-domain 14-like n=1 Tax=Cucurbita pepo subsp. pepo TaxID=3664 RepID=UPI000C9D82C3|nr:protein indeterminate-domain 14-like [Cucurbita pepo subsp. pepo]